MSHEDLLEQAKDAADDLFGDQSVGRETTKESLEDLQGHIEIMLDSM